MTQKLYVSSVIQAVLLKEVLIPEMNNGFWKDHRPAGHGARWLDVEFIVSSTGELGPVDFIVPRLYNFVNTEFLDATEKRLIETAQSIKPNSNLRSVKKELIELSRIIGGRLTDRNGVPKKAYNWNEKNLRRESLVHHDESTVKKTVKKNPNVTVQLSASGTVHTQME